VLNKTWLSMALAIVLLGAAAPAASGQLRRGPVRPAPVFRPAPIDHRRLVGPVRYHDIDTSWQNSPYTYYLIHHHRDWPPYGPYYPPYYPPYPYPYYPPYYPGGYSPDFTVPDYYGGYTDSANPYSDRPTTAVLPKIEGNNAVIHVRVPLALADVTFDGYQTSTTGMNRVFTTPELEPGKTYTYSVTANWSEGGLPRSVTKTVQVKAGESTTVDLS
jgi:uncharacterized protein (TIGR03000 family)